MVLVAVLPSCSKKDLTAFKADAAVNFIETLTEYSFLGNPDKEYIQEIEVRVIGDSTNYDRQFTAEPIMDTNTTASAEQYQILGGIVKAGKFTGVLRIKLINSPELATTQVSLKVKLVNSNDFKAGNKEASEFKVRWTGKVILPAWSIFRLYFTTSASTAAYKLIVQLTGLKTLSPSEHGRLGVAAAQALATKFGDYVKQWNIDHPNDHLKHDDGALAGKEMVPLYYSRSKYD